MYRMIACDIDDTILDPDGKLPPANRDALRRLHERGIAVVLSSGRATVSVRALAEQIYPLTDDTYLLSFNGARVVSAASDNVLYEQFLGPDVTAAVAAYARRESLVLHAYDAHAFLAEPRDARGDERSRLYGRNVSMERVAVPDLAAALPEGTPKLLIIDDHEKLLLHRPRIEEIGAGRLVTTFSKPHYLEILHPDVNKGSGLTHLAEHLGVPLSEVVAVGDNLNDRELLAVAGFGIAVANAHEELKVAADVVLSRTAGGGAIEEVESRFFA
jgi:Cof subfamily protein (haloacid dehalogenase superfamily)